jgi:hypothetical protein
LQVAADRELDMADQDVNIAVLHLRSTW